MSSNKEPNMKSNRTGKTIRRSVTDQCMTTSIAMMNLVSGVGNTPTYNTEQYMSSISDNTSL